jgi:hypothetical protein
MSTVRLSRWTFFVAVLLVFLPDIARAQGSVREALPTDIVAAVARQPSFRPIGPEPGWPVEQPRHLTAGSQAVTEGRGATAKHYVVLPGDTLSGIATHFGIGMDIIARANNLAGVLLVEGMDQLVPWSNEAGVARYGPGGPVVNGPGLHFVASISEQTCWLFHDGVVAQRWACSTGRPESRSIPGNYTVQSRLPRGYSAPADFWMPYWLGIYDAGGFEDGIHGLPYSAATGKKTWEDKVGTPITYGCIMLDDRAAQALYEVAYVGMPVTILP